MLDRLKVTNRAAMGMFSSLFKTASIDGKKASLDEFTCSTSSIYRERNKNRSVLFQLALDEFEEKKPDHLNLHWDGKQISNIIGEKEDYEAILVSGAPSFIEGKLLSVSKMKDELGNNTSTGLAQFTVISEQIRLWDIKDHIRSFTFDTTSSNTGKNTGSCKQIEEFI